jgi:DNA-directed RNA polymerase III subunit RPC1
LKKRTENTGRAVLSPNPQIKMSEIGVPKKMLKRLIQPEKVTSKNIKALQLLVNNGTEYPGANTIQRKMRNK